jgi:hypothetical protein
MLDRRSDYDHSEGMESIQGSRHDLAWHRTGLLGKEAHNRNARSASQK